MELNSSINKQFKKELPAIAVMNRRTKMLEVDTDENNKTI